jgi:hypothetical protein
MTSRRCCCNAQVLCVPSVVLGTVGNDGLALNNGGRLAEWLKWQSPCPGVMTHCISPLAPFFGE